MSEKEKYKFPEFGKNVKYYNKFCKVRLIFENKDAAKEVSSYLIEEEIQFEFSCEYDDDNKIESYDFIIPEYQWNRIRYDIYWETWSEINVRK